MLQVYAFYMMYFVSLHTALSILSILILAISVIFVILAIFVIFNISAIFVIHSMLILSSSSGFFAHTQSYARFHTIMTALPYTLFLMARKSILLLIIFFVLFILFVREGAPIL